MDHTEPKRNPVLVLFGRYARPHRRALGVGLGAQALARVPFQLPDLLIGLAIDAVFLRDSPYRLPLVPSAWLPETTEGQFLLTLVVLAATFPVAELLHRIQISATGRFNAAFQHDVRTNVFDAVQRLNLPYFDDRDTGEVMSILNDDVRELNEFVYGVLHRFANFGVGLVISFAILVWLNWQLALALLVVPVVLGAISYWFSRAMEPRHLTIRERVAELNTRLHNNLDGIDVIKSFHTQDVEANRVRTASQRHRDAQWSAHLLRASTTPVMRLVCNAGATIVLLVGGYWVLFGPPLLFSGELTPGELYVFLSYTWAFVTPMENLSHSVDSYQNAKAAATRLVGVVDGAAVEDRSAGESLADPAGDVVYDDVSFSYEGRDERAVADVALHVEPGETVGIVGPTGAGKSTLLKLLFRFYEPDRGAVRLDGRDIRDVSLASLRSSIGYVSQDPFLFHGTVRENVAYASPDADDGAVREAMELAGGHEFVETLPEGYDTVVGDRGVKLSGGQRQRVAIARAILRDPGILVFDEATSHVDNETEALIQRAIDDLAADRTTFVVAHRLSTVRSADRLFVLDDGAVVERGTHGELLAADGLYADLWRVQIGEVEALPETFLERVRRGDAA